jgi:hypothetical protein
MPRSDTAVLIALVVVVATGFTMGTVVVGAAALLAATGVGMVSGPTVRRVAEQLLDS